MEIVNSYPPNIEAIKDAGLSDETSIYCYGDTVYNPTGKEIPDDILYHEQIHIDQQKRSPTPEMWWLKYIYDRDFRLSQEVEAYARQYQLIKKFYRDKEQKLALEEFAENLSKPMYQLGITHHQAKTKIRLYKY